MVSLKDNLDDDQKQELSMYLKKFHEMQQKFKYEDKTDNSDKYLTKKTINFLDWKKSRQYFHILKLWKKCFIKCNAAAVIIN